jgi:hypothetical protein
MKTEGKTETSLENMVQFSNMEIGFPYFNDKWNFDRDPGAGGGSQGECGFRAESLR